MVKESKSTGSKKSSKKGSPTTSSKPSSTRDLTGVSRPSLRKKKNPKDSGTVWGDQKTKLGRYRFKKWVASLKNADSFLKNDNSIYFYKALSQRHKPVVAKKLKQVDPEGFKKLILRIRQKTFQKNKMKKFIPKEVLKDNAVLVRARKLAVPATSIVKFVDYDGIKGVVALCLASGNTVQKVSEMIGLSIAEINSMVDDVDIASALRRMPEAVANLADQVVMRDLLKGEVTEKTARADMISSRRRKIAIDAHAEKRVDESASKKQLKAKEDNVTNRFGVDRKEGKVIDVEEEK